MEVVINYVFINWIGVIDYIKNDFMKKDKSLEYLFLELVKILDD